MTEMQTLSFPPHDFVGDDYSSSFQSVRGSLVNAQGQRYLDFVKTLQPDYARVKRDIALGYLMLVLSALLCVFLPKLGIHWLIVSIFGAIFIGYWIAYLQLFIHEGAHYNLAPEREKSDLLCNLLIGWMVGTSVQDYRIVHFQHHRALGTVDDSEFTYFFPLNVVFLIKAFLGIRALEVLFSRKELLGKTHVKSETPQLLHLSFFKRHEGKFVLGFGLMIHAAILGFAWAIGASAMLAAWLAGVLVLFPAFGALRQLLEHRGDMADNRTNYKMTDHRAYTRMFGDDAFSATFGGAGFNRHLLHHWQPTVSYTNLPQLETYLLDTQLKPVIEARRTSYAETFLKLLSLH